jgi:hypothetical protein
MPKLSMLAVRSDLTGIRSSLRRHTELDPPLYLLLQHLLPQTIGAKLRIVLDVVPLGVIIAHFEAPPPDRDLQDRVSHAIHFKDNEVILKLHGGFPSRPILGTFMRAQVLRWKGALNRKLDVTAPRRG